MVICDADREQINGDALILCNEACYQIHQIEKDTPAVKQSKR